LKTWCGRYLIVLHSYINISEMSKKRGRDELVASPHVKPERIVEKILNVVSSWRDSCDALFAIDHKVTKDKEKILLKVGFFDELPCDQISSLRQLRLEGDYYIRSMRCVLKQNAVELEIGRQANQVVPATAAPSTSASMPTQDKLDNLKIRVAFGVAENDAVPVQTVLNTLIDSFGPGHVVKLQKIINRPSFYHLHLLIVSGVVPDATIVYASQNRGLVDFENTLLTVEVPKTHPDIID
jgi:hypothetical protein